MEGIIDSEDHSEITGKRVRLLNYGIGRDSRQKLAASAPSPTVACYRSTRVKGMTTGSIEGCARPSDQDSRRNSEICRGRTTDSSSALFVGEVAVEALSLYQVAVVC
jgi:hypothetical protein